jgi:hypothetical protein
MSGIPAFSRERLRTSGLLAVLDRMRWDFPKNHLIQELATATIARMKTAV